jgi:hypothetical protein
MRNIIGSTSTGDLCGVVAGLIVVLAMVGCERSPTPSSGAKPPTKRGVTDARLPANGPALVSPTTAATPGDPPASPTQPVTTSQASEAPRKFIAYYFHRTLRCPTCLSIEKQSQEAIEAAYNGELSAGTLEWQSVNIEEPGNEHFEKDFALERQALTLVELQGEQVQRHKKLERVWELVEDPYAFQEYVVTEVALFLGGG